MRWLERGVFSVAVMVAAVSARAQPRQVVANSGFENGLQGWSAVQGSSLPSVVPGAGVGGSNAIAVTGPGMGLQQVLNTVPGQIYRIDFAVFMPRSTDPTFEFFRIDFNGAMIFSQMLESAPVAHYSFVGDETIATGTQTSLVIRGTTSRSDDVYYVDDFTVTAPEPSSAALVATGLAGLIPCFRRRCQRLRQLAIGVPCDVLARPHVNAG